MHMNEYDIGLAFKAIEDELIASMMRNMKRHKVQEAKEGKQWAMWQAEQLKSLQRYKVQNRKKFQDSFAEINRSISEIIWTARNEGGLQQENAILQAIKRGFKGIGQNSSPAHQAMTGEFFKLNTRKLEALIKATQKDFDKAEHAILRRADDLYRKIIFNAQVYANTGAGTYEKAVDMATKDMLSAGLNCIEYKNGARHTLSDYADMAIRTASKRAYLTGEGEKRQEWGISTVIVNKRGNPCPKCLPFVGKVLVDDVWSGGEAYIDGKQRNQNSTMGVSNHTDKKYPLMSYAISKGLYHPRCRDIHSTYFSGISTADDTWTKEELEAIEADNRKEAKQQYEKRQADKYARLAQYSLDEENKKRYLGKVRIWKNKLNGLEDLITGRTQKLEQGFKDSLHAIGNTDVRVLLTQSSERVKFKLSDRGISYFDGKNIFVSKGAGFDTIAHELFHEVDRTYALTENGMLMDAVNKDYARLQNLSKEYGKSIPEMLYSRYPKAFYRNKNGELRVHEEYRGISDILHGMSRKQITLGYGHNRKGYWDEPLRIQKETFAQFGRMMYEENTDVLRMAKEIFPSCNSEIRNTLKGMIK